MAPNTLFQNYLSVADSKPSISAFLHLMPTPPPAMQPKPERGLPLPTPILMLKHPLQPKDPSIFATPCQHGGRRYEAASETKVHLKN
jgi:hypothetical protein